MKERGRTIDYQLNTINRHHCLKSKPINRCGKSFEPVQVNWAVMESSKLPKLRDAYQMYRQDLTDDLT